MFCDKVWDLLSFGESQALRGHQIEHALQALGQPCCSPRLKVSLLLGTCVCGTARTTSFPRSRRALRHCPAAVACRENQILQTSGRRDGSPMVPETEANGLDVARGACCLSRCAGSYLRMVGVSAVCTYRALSHALGEPGPLQKIAQGRKAEAHATT